MSIFTRAAQTVARFLAPEAPPAPPPFSAPHAPPSTPQGTPFAGGEVAAGATPGVAGRSYFQMPEGFHNETTGMGDPATDDAVTTRFIPRVRLTDWELRALFQQTLTHRIITEPILDMLALGEQDGARAWSYRPAPGLSERDTATAQVYAASIEQALDALPVTLDGGARVIGYTRAVADARTWADVFGGALIVLEFDDNAPLSRPPERPRRILGARVYSRPRVWPQSYYASGYGLLTGRIATYLLDGEVEVHESRVQRLDGIPLDHTGAMENQWWGLSRVEVFYEQLRRFGMGRASSSNTLKDIATAIYTINNLASITSKQGRAALQELWGIRHALKGRFRAIILDANEKAEFRSPQLSGVPDILQMQQGDLCAAAGFPEERLFGRASKGLNSNSDGLTHYYDRIRARRTDEILPLSLSIAQAEMSCTQGPTNGRVLPLAVQFPPVETPSAQAQADTDHKQAQTDAIYLDKQVATVEQVQARTRARYGG